MPVALLVRPALGLFWYEKSEGSPRRRFSAPTSSTGHTFPDPGQYVDATGRFQGNDLDYEMALILPLKPATEAQRLVRGRGLVPARFRFVGATLLPRKVYPNLQLNGLGIRPAESLDV